MMIFSNNEHKYSKQFVIIFLITCILIPAVFSIRDHMDNNEEDYSTPVQSMDPALKKIAPMPAHPYKPLKLSIKVPYIMPISPVLPDKKANDKDGPKIEPPQLVEAAKGYFDDVLFIGDSRTMGIFEYGDFKKSDFFCSTGMTSIDIFKEKVKIKGVGNVGLKELLKKKSYGKIYVMLGINELGYPKESIIYAYNKLIRHIRGAQPDAIIYIQGNLHITKERSDEDKYFNNRRIDSINQSTKKFVDNIHVFYIEANEIFDDKNKALNPKYSSDSAHLLAKYYKKWCDWIRNNTVPETTS